MNYSWVKAAAKVGVCPTAEEALERCTGAVNAKDGVFDSFVAAMSWSSTGMTPSSQDDAKGVRFLRQHMGEQEAKSKQCDLIIEGIKTVMGWEDVYEPPETTDEHSEKDDQDEHDDESIEEAVVWNTLIQTCEYKLVESLVTSLKDIDIAGSVELRASSTDLYDLANPNQASVQRTIVNI